MSYVTDQQKLALQKISGATSQQQLAEIANLYLGDFGHALSFRCGGYKSIAVHVGGDVVLEAIHQRWDDFNPPAC